MSVVTIPKGTWVLVADGEKALFLSNEGDAFTPDLRVVRVLEHPALPNREQGTDRPGRYQDGPQAMRSAVENADWQRLEKSRFAAQIADALYRAAHAGRFERLILAAPPQALGDLRKVLHKMVQARILAEIDKDLTNYPPEQIGRHLMA